MWSRFGLRPFPLPTCESASTRTEPGCPVLQTTPSVVKAATKATPIVNSGYAAANTTPPRIRNAAANPCGFTRTLMSLPNAKTTAPKTEAIPPYSVLTIGPTGIRSSARQELAINRQTAPKTAKGNLTIAPIAEPLVRNRYPTATIGILIIDVTTTNGNVIIDPSTEPMPLGSCRDFLLALRFIQIPSRQRRPNFPAVDSRSTTSQIHRDKKRLCAL